MFLFLVPESGAACSKDSDCEYKFPAWPGECVDFKCRRQGGNSGPSTTTIGETMSLEMCITREKREECRNFWAGGYVIHGTDGQCKCGGPALKFTKVKNQCEKEHGDNFDGYLRNCDWFYPEVKCRCGLKVAE